MHAMRREDVACGLLLVKRRGLHGVHSEEPQKSHREREKTMRDYYEEQLDPHRALLCRARVEADLADEALRIADENSDELASQSLYCAALREAERNAKRMLENVKKLKRIEGID